MSDSDSFIDEVSEEVRRDRLFKLMRKWGWIPVLIVILIVAGAAYNEWRKAQIRAAAEARGTAILAALEAEEPSARATALDSIEADGPAAALIGMIEAAERSAAEDPQAAADTLAEIAGNSELPLVYRQLAILKHAIVTAPTTEPDDRIAALSPLTAPGAAFRVLAEEQIALAEAEKGDTEAAIRRLDALLQDTEASQNLRARARQLIIALGGTAQQT